MIKKSTSWTTLIYGITLIALGAYGYYQQGSKVSFYMGTSFGLLMILSAALMFFRIKAGSYAAIFLTLLLTGTFALRYSQSHKGLPALLSVISAGMLLYLLVQTTKWKK